ncbi:subtilisin family serine protease [Micromonospora pisi]|uniref:Subtilisin family serine protease n=1 Tax=Micromonospora pisi TaxID=589240 RepID=A0A495JD36_9ACTN|nr:subtilisin family serine protease [Micromonospora pisi]
MSARQSHRGGGRFMLRSSVAILATVALGATAQPALAAPAAPSATVEAGVFKEISSKGSTTFMVFLREQAKLDGAARLRDADAKATEVHRQLTGTADRTQAGLRADLDAKKATYTPYWIANALRVVGDKALVDSIAARPEVARIEPVKYYPLITPTPSKTTAAANPAGVEWGLTNIGAPRVWSEYDDRGEGIVIANIDSGVQYDHPALVGKYRGNKGDGTFDHNYNWFDPANVCGGPTPCDNSGHGTHTMGTMVGDDGNGNQTGVAPGAKWIAAKGCETNSCSDTSLLASGQWMLAPTDANGQNPRPDLRPDIVNNSWGGGSGDSWYEQTITAWRAAGIFPAFASGNTLGGAPCGSASSPGDNVPAYAVGAYDVNNVIADFSNRGPTVDGRTKPEIAAPGVSIRSSVPGNGYESWDGTSMATPHLSGAVALIWSAATSLRGDISATEALLAQTATDTEALACGGTIANNNIFGEGRLNAYQAVTAAPRGSVGQVTGTVTNSDTGAGVAGVTIAAGARSVTTGADGTYSLTLSVGEQTLTFSAYGYATQTVTLTVAEGGSVTKNIALVETPPVTVTGKVTDGSGHGWPLYASIEVAGRPGAPIFTDPTTGAYSFTVPGNSSYRLTTTARYQGYQKVTTELNLGTAATTANIAVPVEEACTAAGYSATLSAPLLSQSFDGDTAPEGWSVKSRTDGGSWSFKNEGGRSNLTGGSGNFAVIDSDHAGRDATQDSDLVTPAIDLTGMRAPQLRFKADRYSTGGDNTFDVEVSSDGGENWINVRHDFNSRRGPAAEEVLLTPVANKANVQLRFRYQGAYDWWWQVDDVQVINRSCNPVPGGLVTGFTTDVNTGTAVNDVTVTSVDQPQDKGVSAATPDDPNLSDGFYWFFSGLTGAHSFSASKSPYPSQAKTVTVTPNGVKKADFALKAGRLTVDSTNVESHQPYGSTRTTTVTVKNTGTAPANVELLERSGDFELLSLPGAALTERRMKGLSAAMTVTPYPGVAGGPAAAGPTADGAWKQIADLPSEIFDNAAATVDGRVYSFGGANGSGNERKAWVYQPETNTWGALPALPTGRAKPSAVAVDGKIYLIGGWATGGTPVASVDVYDPTANAWSTVAGATNPAPRAAAGAAVVGGKVHLIGGCASSNCAGSDDVVVFDPATGGFSLGAKYPHTVAWMSCGGIGGSAYCAGGTSGGTSYKDAFSYDPKSDSWSALPDMPIDLWGSQFATAGGLLVIAGGVTGNSSGLTNRTLAYNPAGRAWEDLPNVGFPVYRGALACGTYKLGGSPNPGEASKQAEQLGGLGECEAGDAPWLATTPGTFTLAPGATKKVTLTLTATAETGIDQPGAYHTDLVLRSDTPYAVPAVNVELNVSAPNGWGKIQGTVTGLSCDGRRVPVKATVRLNLADGGYTLTADGQGHYTYWLPRGKYQVIVAKDGWVPEVVQQQIQPGFVSTLDITLDPVTACDARVGGI